MVQVLSTEQCAYCRRKTDQACDWCAFMDKVGKPICSRHAFTRSPWNSELHTLCPEHMQRLREARTAWCHERGAILVKQFVWRATQAYQWEPYILRIDQH